MRFNIYGDGSCPQLPDSTTNDEGNGVEEAPLLAVDMDETSENASETDGNDELHNNNGNERNNEANPEEESCKCTLAQTSNLDESDDGEGNSGCGAGHSNEQETSHANAAISDQSSASVATIGEDSHVISDQSSVSVATIRNADPVSDDNMIDDAMMDNNPPAVPENANNAAGNNEAIEIVVGENAVNENDYHIAYPWNNMESQEEFDLSNNLQIDPEDNTVIANLPYLQVVNLQEAPDYLMPNPRNSANPLPGASSYLDNGPGPSLNTSNDGAGRQRNHFYSRDAIRRSPRRRVSARSASTSAQESSRHPRLAGPHDSSHPTRNRGQSRMSIVGILLNFISDPASSNGGELLPVDGSSINVHNGGIRTRSRDVGMYNRDLGHHSAQRRLGMRAGSGLIDRQLSFNARLPICDDDRNASADDGTMQVDNDIVDLLANQNDAAEPAENLEDPAPAEGRDN